LPEGALPGAGQKGTGKLKSNPGSLEATRGAWVAGLSAGCWCETGAWQAGGAVRFTQQSTYPADPSSSEAEQTTSEAGHQAQR